jgi:Tfp pilus assembly protein PilE
VTSENGQGGAITSVEAFVLAVMAAILIAIAVPSYITMQNRSSDATARAQLRDAAETLDARGVEGGAAGESTRCLERTVRGRTWHLTFPEQSLLRGGCP